MIINRETGEVIEPTNMVRTPRGVSLRQTSDPVGQSLTQQAAKDQTDINDIVKRYQRTGQMPPTKEGVFMDTTPYSGTLTELHQNAQETLSTYDNFRANYKERAEDTTAPTKDTPAGTSPDVNTKT